jgi:hypothetical protein
VDGCERSAAQLLKLRSCTAKRFPSYRKGNNAAVLTGSTAMPEAVIGGLLVAAGLIGFVTHRDKLRFRTGCPLGPQVLGEALLRQQHGGRIWARRNFGAGSTFEFTLYVSKGGT